MIYILINLAQMIQAAAPTPSLHWGVKEQGLLVSINQQASCISRQGDNCSVFPLGTSQRAHICNNVPGKTWPVENC